MKNLIAIGKNVDGNEVRFTFEGGALYCWDKQLTELKIPMGVTKVRCHRNQLKELKLPEGVEWVECEHNQLTHLDLPESVTYLECDKEVIGLERYVGKVRMKLR